MTCEWRDKIFSIGKSGFGRLSLEIFHFQYKENISYRSYVDALGIKPQDVTKLEQIPFLPVSFFKTNDIKTGKFNAQQIFESSGTTQTTNSHHHVKDISIYVESLTKTFKMMYGNVSDYCIIGLLPSYLEKGNSSLVYMVDKLIHDSQHAQSGFYLHDHEKLAETLKSLEAAKQKTMLIGVTYALLDFAEQFQMPLKNTIIMETGGMKGRRREMTRMEVHDILKKAFLVNEIHSEYGMTELLSQAYAKKGGRFYCPEWMKILIRDDEDPLTVQDRRENDKPLSGAINIIDLANVYSCSFIATDDVGKLYADDGFEVLGRMDDSDLRGCSLLTV